MNENNGQRSYHVPSDRKRPYFTNVVNQLLPIQCAIFHVPVTLTLSGHLVVTYSPDHDINLSPYFLVRQTQTSLVALPHQPLVSTFRLSWKVYMHASYLSDKSVNPLRLPVSFTDFCLNLPAHGRSGFSHRFKFNFVAQKLIQAHYCL